MTPNTGKMPRSLAGMRIRGVLANGSRFGFEPIGNALPPGWAADTTRWTLTGSPHDISEYEVAK